MLRALIWLIALFAAAVGLVLAWHYNQAYALLVFPPWRVQISMELLVLLLLASFFLLYSLSRFVSQTMRLPIEVKAWRAQRKRDNATRLLNDAERFFMEGRVGQALRHAEMAVEVGAPQGLGALLAARSAHAMREHDRRDHWLEVARSHDKDIRMARLVLEAEFAVADRRFDDAANRLDELRLAGHRHIAVQRLALQTEQARGRWDEVARIARQLRKVRALSAEQAAPLVRRALIEQMREAEGELEPLQRVWNGITTEERRDVGLLLRAVPYLVASGDLVLGVTAIEEALERDWEPELAILYGRCHTLNLHRQLVTAEGWLRQHPEDSGLLLTLARLCLRAQLWGKAQSYLEASLSLAPSRIAHLELAKLADSLGRPEEAQRHYRAAAEQGA
ncbi:heme biosynthesis HemY N-terminal domain-containing protein [Uliginosibacterium sp. H3]|uniref:Heme biosynthesis HemY N-terminal domain-containing protein n=1 Tax=Uliginosibacterium silvisoli TaxID=3114758 RepID=A0ABU6JZ78_9RHOO|nr:heme biosynthesis HemY N-terminal domain-containing protein [Uliginosibacterium sp. H3]